MLGRILDDDEIGEILAPFHSKWNKTFFGSPCMSEETVIKIVEAAYEKALDDNR